MGSAPTPVSRPAAAFDPRARLLAFAVLLATVLGLGTLTGAAVALGAALAAALLARPPAAAWRRLGRLEALVVVLLVVVPLSVPGPPLVTLGPLAISAEGLERAASLALRINTAAVLAVALVAVVDPVRLAQALAWARLPARLVHLLVMVIRLMPLLEAEILRLRQAMRARGFVARGDRHSLAVAGTLVAMVLVRTLDRAERVSEAMRARGFAGRLPVDRDAHFGAADAWLGVAVALAAAALTALDRAA